MSLSNISEWKDLLWWCQGVLECMNYSNILKGSSSFLELDLEKLRTELSSVLVYYSISKSLFLNLIRGWWIWLPLSSQSSQTSKSQQIAHLYLIPVKFFFLQISQVIDVWINEQDSFDLFRTYILSSN